MSGLVWETGGIRGQRLKLLLTFLLTVLFLWTLLTTLTSSDSHVEPHRPPAQKKSEKKAPSVSSDNMGEEKVEKQQKTDLNTTDLDKDRTERKHKTTAHTSHVEPHRPPAQKESEKKAPSVSSDNRPPAQKESEKKAPSVSSDNSHVEPDRPPAQKESEKKAPSVSSDNNHVEPHRPPAQKKSEKKAPSVSSDNIHVEPPNAPAQKESEKKAPSAPSYNCNGCKTVIDKVLKNYSQTWTKQEVNYQKFRSQLKTKCNGIDKAIITQANTPVGSKLVYDGERNKVYQVNSELFKTFVKESPFSNKTWDTCAVVGSGGILANSSCGKAIDSAQFVIRCNLPPVENEFKAHVGSKTEIVTANPSILIEKYGSLSGHRRPFVESLHKYGNSMLLLPAFSYTVNTPVCLRALYTIEDFEIPIQTVFFNPKYLQSLDEFWRTQGLKAIRPSTGLMMVSLALEICSNVHLYGFWPFSNHPHGFQPLNNHYYDNKPPVKGVHAMPVEFNLLLQLHSQGVLRVHLGQCGKQ
ncbi:alpha-2,8-sialyltransferase 8E-like isoform X2 [Sphaeramia orbicularis]|uniref:alpha-2,8-sialyltransferase 8E-like isoform X2 n=1 Tax=Sphaeramia orbicularis TaxID=375764 RepID=UPI00117DB8B1|nr:alpha-2,8-sialyltransferase 8E-like isoform X2 [Sphaeramia orbicularis]